MLGQIEYDAVMGNPGRLQENPNSHRSHQKIPKWNISLINTPAIILQQ